MKVINYRRYRIIFVVIAVLLAVLAVVFWKYSYIDYKSAGDELYSIKYPKDMQVKASKIPESPGSSQMVDAIFIVKDLKNPLSGPFINIVIASNTKHQTPLQIANENKADKQLTDIKLDGRDGVKSVSVAEGVIKKNTKTRGAQYITAKNNRIYAVEFISDDTDKHFQGQESKIINSFKIK